MLIGSTAPLQFTAPCTSLKNDLKQAQQALQRMFDDAKNAFGNDDPSDTLVLSHKQQPYVRQASGPFLVVARNGAAAKGWARERGLRASEWTYATSVEKLLDNRRHHVVAVTGWHERPDAEAMVKAVEVRGGKLELPNAA